MSGMVKVPVPTTLATVLPEIDPNMAEAPTAPCAAPPRVPPASAMAILISASPAPDFVMMDPNTM